MPDLASLHWLRPWCLLGVPLAFVLGWMAGRRYRVAKAWRGQIAPHLLPHLVVRPTSSALPWSRIWLVVVIALASVALAGPSWEHELPAFAQNDAALVVVVDLDQSMNAIDVAPTRLARAKEKIGELLALRPGARTALVVFAATAHGVLPFTDDADILQRYLATLETRLMPKVPDRGHRLADALTLADQMLAREPGAQHGTVLVVSAGQQLGAPVGAGGRDALLWLFGHGAKAPLARDGRGVGSGLLASPAAARDEASIAAWVNASDLRRVDATVGDDDVTAVHRLIEQHFAQSAVEDEQDRPWRDRGSVLFWPLVLWSALGFRRGGGVRW